MKLDHSLVTRIEACVERICDLGCAEVYRVIEMLQRDQAVAQVDGMDRQARQLVLSELLSIMAVYDSREDGPSCQVRPNHGTQEGSEPN